MSRAVNEELPCRNTSEFFAERLQDAKLDHGKTLLQRQIEETDASIDKLVYELYGLTVEEIKVVEYQSLDLREYLKIFFPLGTF
jgi:hypothetical protein